jgi:hypothetical protein
MLLALPALPALAADESSLGLYVQEAGGRAPRCDQIEPQDCESGDLETSGDLFTPYYVYLSVFKADASRGVSGLQCGLEYNASSISVSGWTKCTALEFPNNGWPASGGSNRITWDKTIDCQTEEPGGSGTGVSAVAGYFYVMAYAEDVFQITTWRGEREEPVQVADCESASIDIPLERVGAIAFSDGAATEGYLPCGRPKEETTIGRIKSTYNN